jgi:hypothetical protein
MPGVSTPIRIRVSYLSHRNGHDPALLDSLSRKDEKSSETAESRLRDLLHFIIEARAKD